MTDAVISTPDPRVTTSGPRRLSVLLFSDDASVRDQVRVGVGRRPSRELEIAAWRECATADAVLEAVRSETFDLLVLDGEAQPYGGLGLSKQLHQEHETCPPIVVLVGRAADGWLAAWSECDDVVIHPVDPQEMTRAITRAAGRTA